jgi:hypothetical protein
LGSVCLAGLLKTQEHRHVAIVRWPRRFFATSRGEPLLDLNRGTQPAAPEIDRWLRRPAVSV